ncbi:MAG: hypothetical protein ACXV3F_00390 [Frankiaceae bacterium]
MPATVPSPLLYPYRYLFPGQTPPPGLLISVGPARSRTLQAVGAAVNLSRIDRKYADYPITVTLRDGTTVTPAGVDVALLPPRTGPTSSTTWTAAQFTAGTATVLLAGPDADPTGALAVPVGGGDLWFRITDSPEVEAVKADRITVS